MNWYKLNDGGSDVAITPGSRIVPASDQTDLGLYYLICADQVEAEAREEFPGGVATIPADVKNAAKAAWRDRFSVYDGTHQWARRAHVAAWAGHGTARGNFGSQARRDA